MCRLPVFRSVASITAKTPPTGVDSLALANLAIGDRLYHDIPFSGVREWVVMGGNSMAVQDDRRCAGVTVHVMCGGSHVVMVGLLAVVECGIGRDSTLADVLANDVMADHSDRRHCCSDNLVSTQQKDRIADVARRI
jgi:hypothetical protein